MTLDPSGYLLQVGNVCHQWSYAEYLLSKTIWHILGVDKEIGLIITQGKDIVPKAEMAIALAQKLNSAPEIMNALENTKKTAESLSKKRNRVVHGVFSSHEMAVVPMVEIHRGKKAGIKEAIPLDEIRNLGADIHKMAFELAATLEKYGIDTH